MEKDGTLVCGGGRYRALVSRGFEYSLATQSVDVAEGRQNLTCPAFTIDLALLTSATPFPPLPVVKKWTPLRLPLNSSNLGGESEGDHIITLIKPQFEAGRKEVAKGDGVVRDPEIHRKVLLDVLTFAESEGLAVRGLIRSPLQGPKGNVEFLAWMGLSGESILFEGAIQTALAG